MKPIVLVGCCKKKNSLPLQAQHLYASPLFRGCKQYALKRELLWFILSAKYGLLQPENLVAPYDLTLDKMSKDDRRVWANRVYGQLVQVLDPGVTHVIVLAGERYREHLVPLLIYKGLTIDIPLRGMQIGEQLRYLKTR